MAEPLVDLHPEVTEALHPNKTIAVVRAQDAVLALSDQRVIVHSGHRMELNMALSGVRRIQFDIEVGRPSTLVIVPHDPHHEPQVLGIPHAETRAAVDALVLVADHMARLS